MKSRFLAVLALCLVAPFVVIFGACNENNPDADEVRLTSVRVDVANGSWCAGLLSNNVFTLDNYDANISSFTKSDFVVTAEYSDGQTKILGADDNYTFTVNTNPAGEITKNGKIYSIYNIIIAYGENSQHNFVVHKLKYDPSTALALPMLTGLTLDNTIDGRTTYSVNDASNLIYDGLEKNIFDYVSAGNQTLKNLVDSEKITVGSNEYAATDAGIYSVSIWPSAGYKWAAAFRSEPMIEITIMWDIKKVRLDSPTLVNTRVHFREDKNPETGVLEAVPVAPLVTFVGEQQEFFDELTKQTTIGNYNAVISIKNEYTRNYYLESDGEEVTSVDLGEWEIVPGTLNQYLNSVDFITIINSFTFPYQAKEYTADEICSILGLDAIDSNWNEKIEISIPSNTVEDGVAIDNKNVSVEDVRRGAISVSAKSNGSYSYIDEETTRIILFNITPYDITNSYRVGVSGVNQYYEYTGEAISVSPMLMVDFNDVSSEDEEYDLDRKIEIGSLYYEIAYPEEENYLVTLGAKQGTITLKSYIENGPTKEYCNFTGTFGFSFEIVSQILRVSNFSWIGTELTYNGTNQNDSVVFSVVGTATDSTVYSDMIDVAITFTTNGNKPTTDLTNAGTYEAKATLSLKDDYSNDYTLVCEGPNDTTVEYYTTDVVIKPALIGQVGDEVSQGLVGASIEITPSDNNISYTGSPASPRLIIKANLNGQAKDYTLNSDDYTLSYYERNYGDGPEWKPIEGEIIDVGSYYVEINYSGNFASFYNDQQGYSHSDYFTFDIEKVTFADNNYEDVLDITWPTVSSYIWSNNATVGENGGAITISNSRDEEPYFTLSSLENNLATVVAHFRNYEDVTKTDIEVTYESWFDSVVLNGVSFNNDKELEYELDFTDLNNLSSLSIGDVIDFEFDSSKYTVFEKFLYIDNENNSTSASIKHTTNNTVHYVGGFAEDNNNNRYNEIGYELYIAEADSDADVNNLMYNWLARKSFTIDKLGCFAALEYRNSDDTPDLNYLAQNTLEEESWVVNASQKLYIELNNGFELNYDLVNGNLVTRKETKTSTLELTNDGLFTQVIVYIYHENSTLVYTLHYNFAYTPTQLTGNIAYITTIIEGEEDEAVASTFVFTEEEIEYTDPNTQELISYTNKKFFVLYGEHQLDDLNQDSSYAMLSGNWYYETADVICAEFDDFEIYFKIGENDTLTMQVVDEEILYTYEYEISGGDGSIPMTVAICEGNKYFVCYNMTANDVSVGVPAMSAGEWEMDTDYDDGNHIKAQVYGAWIGFDMTSEVTPYIPETPKYAIVFNENNILTAMLYDTGSAYLFAGDFTEENWQAGFPTDFGNWELTNNDESISFSFAFSELQLMMDVTNFVDLTQ